jgi:N-acetylglucosaminyl-diphospho-decaprenol L-rhamnosyltransferase
MLPGLDIIIVNWNSAIQLRECLEAVVSSERNEFKLERVIVVDNASTDRSLSGLEDLDLPLEIIRNTKNQGFGAACNQGAVNSKSDYLLFLNPDTRASKESLDRAVRFMEKPAHQQVGVVGIQLIGNRGQIQRSCARFLSPATIWCSILGLDKVIKTKSTSYMMTEWDHNNTQSVDHVMGAFYLIRNEIFQSLQGFDESFFVYFEDLDLSYRVHKLGWSSYFLADVQSFHKGGGTSENIKATRLFYSLRSRILYGYKHFGRVQAHMMMLASLSIEPLTRIVFAIVKLSGSQVKETIMGYAQLFANLGAIFKSIGS